MKLKNLILPLLMSAIGAVEAEAGPYFLDAKLMPADGVVKCGQKAVFTAKLLKDGKPAVGEKLHYFIKWEGRVVKQETFTTDDAPIIVEYTSDKPGWAYFGFQILDAVGKPIERPGTQVKQSPKKTLVYETGVMFNPLEVVAKPSRPADFEAFWAAERKRLQTLPMDIKLTPLPNAPSADKVDSFAVSLNCLGRFPVTGYLSIPKNAQEKACPILVDYLSMVRTDASPGVPALAAVKFNAIAFYATWHGLETGHEPKWYDDELKKSYNGLDGIDKLQGWYFHDMYLRVLRVLDYMKSRPEWNGKDLIIRGGSLGGIQSIVAAALEPAVTLVLINVPTGCEFNAADSGRQPPWVMRGRDAKLMENHDIATVLAYHDAVNFAPMFHCDTFVCTGFADETCFPSSVYAFFNALPANIKKVMTTYPHTGHYGTTPNTAGNAFLETQGRQVRFPD